MPAMTMDAGHSSAVNHISKNKTHFSHDGKSCHGIHANDSDRHVKIHKGHGNDSLKSNSHKSHADTNIKHYPKLVQHDERPSHESPKLGEQTLDVAPVMTMENTVIKTDFGTHVCVNSTVPSEKLTSHDCPMAEQGKCLCCENEHCSHDVAICNDKVIINKIGDDSTCYYREYYAQFNTIAGEWETTGSRNRNSKDQDTPQSEYGVYIIPSNSNFEGGFTMDFADQFSGDFKRLDSNGLNIDGGYPQADIADYNMEYYIFTNPDIIIEKANVNVLPTPAKTIYNTNHCLHDLDAISTDFNQTDFNIGLLAENCITGDNYFPIETTFFDNHESSHQDNLPFSCPMMKAAFHLIFLEELLYV